MELTWPDYAKRRNGLAVGSKGELRQNLRRAFTASSFGRFWQIWNPLFGFYLQKFIYRPLQRWCSKPLALWLTFVGNGLLHDVVTMLARWDVAFFFIPWFSLLGAVVIIESQFQWQLRASPTFLRIFYHVALLLGSATLAWQFRV